MASASHPASLAGLAGILQSEVAAARTAARRQAPVVVDARARRPLGRDALPVGPVRQHRRDLLHLFRDQRDLDPDCWRRGNLLARDHGRGRHLRLRRRRGECLSRLALAADDADRRYGRLPVRPPAGAAFDATRRSLLCPADTWHRRDLPGLDHPDQGAGAEQQQHQQRRFLHPGRLASAASRPADRFRRFFPADARGAAGVPPDQQRTPRAVAAECARGRGLFRGGRDRLPPRALVGVRAGVQRARHHRRLLCHVLSLDFACRVLAGPAAAAVRDDRDRRPRPLGGRRARHGDRGA